MMMSFIHITKLGLVSPTLKNHKLGIINSPAVLYRF